MASVPDMYLCKASTATRYSITTAIHASAPPLDNADVEAEEFNPFCGDRVILQLSVDRKGLVADASARSEGCSIIQASASMLAQMTLGKSLEQVESVADRFRSMMQRKPAPGEDMGGLEDLLPLQVVRQFPVRIKCALLPWTALEIGIEGLQSPGRRLTLLKNYFKTHRNTQPVIPMKIGIFTPHTCPNRAIRPSRENRHFYASYMAVAGPSIIPAPLPVIPAQAGRESTPPPEAATLPASVIPAQAGIHRLHSA